MFEVTPFGLLISAALVVIIVIEVGAAKAKRHLDAWQRRADWQRKYRGQKDEN